MQRNQDMNHDRVQEALSPRPLSTTAVERFSRQIALPGIGTEGQIRLRSARVLLVGVGGLGCPAALYLAAAGIGTIGLVDGDAVELSNLQRQILHTTPDIGRRKVETAAARLTALNPDVSVQAHAERFTPENALPLIESYGFVVDATDNLTTKFLIADACHAAGMPYSHAGISEFMGQTITVLPGESCCYRCIFDAPPPDHACAPRGPLGVVPAVIGSVQATEALKFILGIGELLTNTLLIYDSLAMTFRRVKTPRSLSCPLCGRPSPPATQPGRQASTTAAGLQSQEDV